MAGTDGDIKIGVELALSKFEKQLKELERKVKKQETRTKLKLDAKLQAEKALDTYKEKVKKIQQEYDKTAQQIERINKIQQNQGKRIALKPEDLEDLQNYDEILQKHEKLKAKLAEEGDQQHNLANRVEETTLAYEEAEERLAKYQQKLDDYRSADEVSMAYTIAGQTFENQEQADEYLNTLQQISEETAGIEDKKVKIPVETVKKAEQVKQEVKEIGNNIQKVAQKEKEVSKNAEEVTKKMQDVKKDAYIQLPIEIETDKFDKQIARLNEKIAKKGREKARIDIQIKNIKDSENPYNDLVRKSEEYKDKVRDVEATIRRLVGVQKSLTTGGLKATDIPEYNKVSAELQKARDNAQSLNNELQRTNKEVEKWDSKIISNNNRMESLRAKQGEITREVAKYRKEIESVKMQKQQAQVKNLSDGFNKVAKSTSNFAKNIARMALGVISVASAYKLLSHASSTLGQYDKQYASNLEYINYLIAQALAPALRALVNLASTLLSYLNYIVNAWFGLTLFSKNSAKNFANAQKSTSKMKKDLQTAGFDEMNVLSDTSSTAGGGGATMPSVDPSQLAGEVPEWLKWIAENKDIVIAALTGIAIAIGLIKLSNLVGGLKNLGIFLKPIKTFFSTHWKLISGIAAIIGGIALIIDGVIKYLKDPSWENFIEIMAGIALVVGGVALLFGGIPALITAIILIIAALGLAIYKHWNEIKETLGKVGSWINEHIIQPVGQFFTDLWNKIKDGVKNAVQSVKDTFSTVVSFFKNLISKIVDAFKNLGTKVGKVISSAFKTVVNAVLKTIEKVLNAPIKTVNKLIGVINNVPGIDLGTLPTFNLPRLAKGSILNAPGRGVPVAGGTALAGEAGREAYLPLSDTQLLEELGSTIGKYITINAHIVNTMNGRVISRQLQKVQNDNNFAYNL